MTSRLIALASLARPDALADNRGPEGGAQARETGMNEATLAELYNRHAPAIYAHCRRVLGSSAAARDATQEAFVRVLTRAPGRLEGADALRYLYRVATNVCLNQIREAKVRERAASGMLARSQAVPTGEQQQANRQFAAALLERCDDTGTAIAIMHYVDEMTQVEIAATLGITRRTVFNRLRKIQEVAQDLLGLREAAASPDLPDANPGA